jgi:hypothetical protein
LHSVMEVECIHPGGFSRECDWAFHNAPIVGGARWLRGQRGAEPFGADADQCRLFPTSDQIADNRE